MEDGCVLSTQIERRCSTDDAGVLRCQTLKRVWRHCPGKPPEELSVDSAENEGTHSPPELPWPHHSAPHHGAGPGFGGFGSLGGFGGGFEHMLSQMQSMMEAFGGGLGGGGLGGGGFGPMPPGASGPPQQPQVRVDEV